MKAVQMTKEIKLTILNNFKAFKTINFIKKTNFIKNRENLHLFHLMFFNLFFLFLACQPITAIINDDLSIDGLEWRILMGILKRRKYTPAISQARILIEQLPLFELNQKEYKINLF